jgi:DNA-binding MarR family transcriptional regulator
MTLATTTDAAATAAKPAAIKRIAPFFGAALHQACQRYDTAFGDKLKGVVTVPQLMILLAVMDHDGESHTRLVEVTGIDRSTLSDVARRMIKKGWLKRKRTKADARAYAVEITADGRKIVSKAMPVVQALEADIKSEIQQSLRKA